MRWIKWTGVLAGVALIVTGFLTWVTVASKQIIVTGVGSTWINEQGARAEWDYFGKPAYFHFLMAFLFILFSLIPRVWAKRSNLIVAALNLAWAVRNYFIISLCRGGECPEKHTAIYLLPLISTIILVAALLPDLKLRENPQPGTSA